MNNFTCKRLYPSPPSYCHSTEICDLGDTSDYADISDYIQDALSVLRDYHQLERYECDEPIETQEFSGWGQHVYKFEGVYPDGSEETRFYAFSEHD